MDTRNHPEVIPVVGYGSSAELESAPGQVTREMYNLTPEQLDEIERSLVDSLRTYPDPETGTTHDTGVVAVVVPGGHPMASFGRTLETDTFVKKRGEDYDFFVGMEPYELYSTFVYTVDLDLGKIAHCKRIVAARPIEQRETARLTGIEPIDDRITAFVPEEFAEEAEILAQHGIDDIGKVFNVATNETTDRAEQTLSKPYTLLSYKAIFELVQAQGYTHILAYLNPAATRSLARFGVEAELLGGKEFHLPVPPSPESEDQTVAYDQDYLAVCIPGSEANVAAFTDINSSNRLARLIAGKEVPLVFLRDPLEASVAA